MNIYSFSELNGNRRFAERDWICCYRFNMPMRNRLLSFFIVHRIGNSRPSNCCRDISPTWKTKSTMNEIFSLKMTSAEINPYFFQTLPRHRWSESQMYLDSIIYREWRLPQNRQNVLITADVFIIIIIISLSTSFKFAAELGLLIVFVLTSNGSMTTNKGYF